MKALTERANSIKPFLYTMVRNECITYLRRRNMKTKAVIYLQAQQADETYFDEVTFAETVQLVFECIEELLPRMSTIIKKYYLQGKRHKKIAAELLSTENAIKIHKRKAIKLVKLKVSHLKR